MYPPERRARGISYVLFGALFGAALGPLVFRPLFAGKDLDTDALVVPWVAAAGIMVVGLVLVLLVRPDPRTIARKLHFDSGGVEGEPAPLAEILRRPGVLTALVAAVASFACMAAVMNLTGYIVIDHGHHQSDVFTVISLHIVGMYALVLVIGQLIDKVGRRPGQVAGPLHDGASRRSGSSGSRAWRGRPCRSSCSVSAGTSPMSRPSTELADRALPAERGKLIGLTDQLSSFTAAALVLLGGVAYSELGVEALAVSATAFVALPALWILLRSAAGAPDVRPLSVK